MLVMTIQSKDIALKMLEGEYQADFWKSSFSCLSPRFTKGYKILNEEIKVKTGRYCSSPVFGWVGIPFVDFFQFAKKDMIVLFLEVPNSEVILSNYDRFCDFVNGDSKKEGFIISKNSLINRGHCLQACMGVVKPEWVLTSIELPYVSDFCGTVDDFYRYCKLLQSYFFVKTHGVVRLSEIA